MVNFQEPSTNRLINIIFEIMIIKASKHQSKTPKQTLPFIESLEQLNSYLNKKKKKKKNV